MYCSNCGAQVREDDYACYNCGMILNPSKAPHKHNSDKKNIIIVILIITILLLVAGIAAFIIRKHNTSKKVTEALETNDIETAVELIDEVDDEEARLAIQESLIEHAREVRDNYIAESCSYDDARTELDALDGKIEDYVDEFNDICKYIETIQDSRRAYEKAENSYNSGDYNNAIQEYSKVIEEDTKYYDLAQDGLKKCDEGIKSLLIGKWTYKYDIKKEVMKYIQDAGFDFDLSSIKMPVDLIFTLNEDGSIDMTLDKETLEENVDKVIDLGVQTILDGFKNKGLSETEISVAVNLLYGTTDIKSVIKDQLKYDTIVSRLDTELENMEIDNYRVEGGKLYFGETEINVTFKDNTVMLECEKQDSIQVGEYSMAFPITFTKYEKTAN